MIYASTRRDRSGASHRTGVQVRADAALVLGLPTVACSISLARVGVATDCTARRHLREYRPARCAVAMMVAAAAKLLLGGGHLPLATARDNHAAASASAVLLAGDLRQHHAGSALLRHRRRRAAAGLLLRACDARRPRRQRSFVRGTIVTLCSCARRRRAARALPVLRRRRGAAMPGAAADDATPDTVHAPRPRSCAPLCTSGRPAHRRACCASPAGSASARCRAPARPTRTTTMVCGFCSTGCSLDVHLQRRRGGQPHADDRLSGQPRHGLSEGLGGAHRARRRPTAPRRRCCATPRGRLRAGRLGHGATRRSVERIQGDPAPSTGPSRSPSSAPARSPPRKWRSSARWPSSAWAWCTATATRGSAWPRRSSPTSSRSASTRRRTPTPTSRSPT